MGSDQGAEFKVDRLPQVSQEIRELGLKAKAYGLKPEYVSALQSILAKLKHDPLLWGDPEYHGKLEGSTVCHGTMGPLFVRYVVYEPQRSVVILRLDALSGSALD